MYKFIIIFLINFIGAIIPIVICLHFDYGDVWELVDCNFIVRIQNSHFDKKNIKISIKLFFGKHCTCKASLKKNFIFFFFIYLLFLQCCNLFLEFISYCNAI